jgi:hypothetical protein
MLLEELKQLVGEKGPEHIFDLYITGDNEISDDDIQMLLTDIPEDGKKVWQSFVKSKMKEYGYDIDGCNRLITLGAKCDISLDDYLKISGAPYSPDVEMLFFCLSDAYLNGSYGLEKDKMKSCLIYENIITATEAWSGDYQDDFSYEFFWQIITNYMRGDWDDECMGRIADKILTYAVELEGEITRQTPAFEVAYRFLMNRMHSSSTAKDFHEYVHDFLEDVLVYYLTRKVDNEHIVKVAEFICSYHAEPGLETCHFANFWVNHAKIFIPYKQYKTSMKRLSENPQYKSAKEELEKMAETGNAIAQCDLAYCYAFGIGTDMDMEKAVQWCKKSAVLGYTYAKRCLFDLEHLGKPAPYTTTERNQTKENSPKAKSKMKIIKSKIKSIVKILSKKIGW